MGKIMEKMNYTPVWWKIHRERKMSLNTVYDFEWCFDYDTGVWHSIDTGLSYTKEQVTHWMPLPTPPAPRKEGSDERG